MTTKKTSDLNAFELVQRMAEGALRCREEAARELFQRMKAGDEASMQTLSEMVNTRVDDGEEHMLVKAFNGLFDRDVHVGLAYYVATLLQLRYHRDDAVIDMRQRRDLVLKGMGLLYVSSAAIPGEVVDVINRAYRALYGGAPASFDSEAPCSC